MYTSTFGGVGRFAAGAMPEWKALDQKLPAGTGFFAWVNEEPVDTSQAVSSFEYICLEDPDWMRDVTERSNRVVEGMCRAVNNGHRREFFRTVNEARAIGHEIGERIAVPATVSELGVAYLNQSGTKWTYKACGAGNERAVVFVAISEISDSGSEAGSLAAIGNICETESLSKTGLHLGVLQIAPEGLTCRPTPPGSRGASSLQ